MATSLNLIDDLAIVQGKTYEKVDLLFPGDKSLWTPHAQIRQSYHYKEVGNSPLISFTFLTLVYDSDADKTLVRPRLSAVQTAELIPTKYQGGTTAIASSNAYVWDLELVDTTGVVIGLDWGYVQVKPEVTVI